jgi:nucleotide-binding universal stress UspA family protein
MDPTVQPTSAAGAPYAPPEQARAGPVLVATDGAPHADSALAVGRLLAARLGAPLRLVSVVDTVLMPMSEAGIYPSLQALDDARCEGRRALVQEQTRKLLGGSERPPTDVVTGIPARAIARVAAECDARLIVAGLGTHRLRDRVVGTETALQLTRLADVPVLAVPPGVTSLPDRAVAAIDFSPFSIRAARVALEVVEEGATVYLAHVASRLGALVAALDRWDDDATIDRAFAELTGDLRVHGEGVLETVTLRGEPADALLEFAQAGGADLIVAGSHGHGFFERLIVGSVATRILRSAPCSVLVVPPATARAPGRARPDPGVEMERWEQRLRAFTKRNAGRRCTMEVDDPALGAQVQARDYPFLGADYDHRDYRVDVALGDGVSGGRHLTRTIPDVHAVDVVEGGPGRADVLRISHGKGQTLVTVPR